MIKETENGGLLDHVFSSDDMHLLRKCPCPVWLVKSKSPKVYRRILAAVDVADYYPPEELNTRHLLNLQILEMANSLALSEFAELHIVNAWWEVVGERALLGPARGPKEEIAAYVEEARQQKLSLNISNVLCLRLNRRDLYRRLHILINTVNRFKAMESYIKEWCQRIFKREIG